MYAIELDGQLTAETFNTFAEARLAGVDYLAAKYRDGSIEHNGEPHIKIVVIPPLGRKRILNEQFGSLRTMRATAIG